MCMHPYVVHVESQRVVGSPVDLDIASDYLIVVDYSSIEPNPATFSDMSFSLAWLNTFQQEIGPVSVMNAPDFENADLSQFRVIVLTQSASWNDAWVPRVRNYIEKGGVVVMEMPSGGLRSIASADGKGGERAAQNITYAAGLNADALKALNELNLSHMTRLVGSAGPLDSAKTYMTIDGVPVIYAKERARGQVITVDFDYGMLLTALQQGRPLDDFSIRNLHETSRIETTDLARTSSITLPAADILERFMIYGVLNEAIPVVTFWPYFDGLAGAMVVTHRENYEGNAALWMPEYESTFKATSTVFVSVPTAMTTEGIDRLIQLHSEPGLAFDLDVNASSKTRRPLGGLRISPVWKQLNLDEQTTALQSQLDGDTPLLSAQAHQGLWSSHYTRAFQMIAAAGFRADASYRANTQTPGYAFSTGIPFMPIDTNGLIFNILEFPVIFPELTSHETVGLLEQFIAESARDQHEVITVSFHPGLFPSNPDAEFFQTWKSAYQIANKHKHWITGILSYFRFNRARFTAELKSRTLETMIGHKKNNVIKIEVLAPEAGMSITVPKKLEDHTFLEARRGVQRVRENAMLSDVIQTTPVTVSGFERLMIPVNRGFNAIDVIYE